MNRVKLIRTLRKYHKWPSLVLSIFTLVFAVSGIILNHRELFSGIDVPRRILLEEYRYKNWNNAAVKAACRISPDSLLVYGNIGVWLTDGNFSTFEDFNNGFPAGIDGRKISRLYLSAEGNLYAGTLFGLYRYHTGDARWKPVVMPVSDRQVVDFAGKDDSIYILTRSLLMVSPDDPDSMNFTTRYLPAPAGYENRESLFKTLWVIHSGEIGGLAGKLIVDLTGIIFIFLTLTGLVYWIFPGWVRKRKKNGRGVSTLVKLNRFSLKYHNKAGVWILLLLLVTTITGMFLRPPLLSTIANASVGKIPLTILDTANPWYDKLRSIIYDRENNCFLIGTNQGIYIFDSGFTRPADKPWPQPPVSIMGINVFERHENGSYLVGSFNGLFLWNPASDLLIDLNNPNVRVNPGKGQSPLSEHLISGYINIHGRQYIFDYNHGVRSIAGSPLFPDMPGALSQCPMSLWNLALEFHTGRYYSFVFGRLYILFIPLFGISMITVLAIGFWLWWKLYRRKGKKHGLFNQME